MALTLRDKIALIYTSAGSQRSVAALVGVSHQKIGRVLHGLSSPRVLGDPGFIAAVNQAFRIHADITRSQARVDMLPYDSQYPIFIQRMSLKDGTPGDRVAALHTHWLPDKIRNAWISTMQRSGKFAAASVGSIVNMVIYSKRADALQGKKYRDPKKELARLEVLQKIQNSISQQIVQGLIYTQYTPMDRSLSPDWVTRDIESKLQTKHAPAVGDAGTAFANTILLQVDTRADKNGNSKDKQFRDKHPRAAKPRKARGNRGKPARRTRRR